MSEAPNEENRSDSDEKMLDELQRETFNYFKYEVNSENGLIKDKTRPDFPSSIAAVGMGLTCYLVGIERGYISREEGSERTLTILRFLKHSQQGKGEQATGYKGFYYHFLDMKSGQRVWRCELSTIDTGFLIAGALAAAQFFDRDTEEENEIRALADFLYRRVDWHWARGGVGKISHGWTPERGFLPYTWDGYDEALLLYVLALGSPTHPVERESYDAFVSTYIWKTIYGKELLYAGPLFIHQYPHIWIDFREIKDDAMRQKSLDYFENSCRSAYVQQQYAIHNPNEFDGYGEYCWGFTASDGPGPMSAKIDGIQRVFFDYVARGVPYGPDDGTISPWAAVASLPFAPDLVIPTIRYFEKIKLRENNPYGFKATFNPTYGKEKGKRMWISPYHFGINQGPVVLMIENYRSEMIWKLMRKCPYIINGLRKAGFTGGWLEG